MPEPSSLLSIYRSDRRVADFLRRWTAAAPGSPEALSGAAGSLPAVVAASALLELKRPIVVVRSDKEEAAYFFNDLEKLLPLGSVLFFPDSYRRPYADRDQTDNANIGLRAEVLDRLRGTQPVAVVTYPEALAEKVITRSQLDARSMEVAVGARLDVNFLNEYLFELHFERVDFVEKPGQFAVRGGIVDVFSFAHPEPHRLEFFGSEVESIRTFDVVDQLTLQHVQRMTLVPNVEDKTSTERRESLTAYAGPSALIWVERPEVALEKLERVYRLAEEAFVGLHSVVRRLEPHELYVRSSEWERELSTRGHAVDGHPGDSASWKTLAQPAFAKNFNLLVETLDAHRTAQRGLWIMCGQESQRERLKAIVSDVHRGEELHINWIDGALHRGWEDPDAGLVAYVDHDLFERYQRFTIRDQHEQAQALTLKELNGLQVGDFVAHIDHGIGKFGGLQKIDVGGVTQEAIKLVYRDSDVLYVSIHSLHKIAPYATKEGTEPSLSKLGSPAWQNAKSKTKRRVKEVAFDLIKLYAKRREAKGFAYSPDSYLQHELEASFAYEDTPDQMKANADVKADMESPIPMDRLICGDVGFGKTEIAVRAAFKAVADSKQVAVLVPTTLLAFQHFRTFSKRLNGLPARVDYLNRSRTAKETKAVLADLEAGRIDVLIGTHRILGKDLNFKNLGLMIIDEEQKFGVNAKDKLKTLKANVDTLTLSATPIPRTLQFSLMSARDLSVMTTPPPNRQPVDTYLIGFNEERLRDAIAYEISRGGQVYVISNRIQNLSEVAGMLQRLVPDARIATGHGQMNGHEMEELILGFMEARFDVLVSTTIVENGLDVPNANTIIILDAHMFGLSDLHQMRGRVGRSNRKAFCYLVSPPLGGLPEESRKRLQALEQFSDLGSGFKIALRDLEIRGAGDLLGAEQSGFINDLGFETYQKLLAEAVEELKKSDFKDLYEDQRGGWSATRECQLDTDWELLLPDAYVNSVEERLRIYRELDALPGPEALAAYRLGLVDRFGALPRAAENLLRSLHIRWLGQSMGMEKIRIKSGKLMAYFPDDANFSIPEHVLGQFLQALQRNPQRFQMKQKDQRSYLVVDAVRNVDEAISLLESWSTPATSDQQPATSNE